MVQKINRLNSFPKGKYRIVKLSLINDVESRLLEMGFLPGIYLYIIQTNSLGIQVRINRATYLLNEVVASMIYVEPIGE